MPLTAALRKQISALKKARERRDAGLFVLEGTRSVLDSAAAFSVRYLLATQAWIEQYGKELPTGLPTPIICKPDEMERMSALQTPQGVMAVCKIPQDEPADITPDMLVLALDCVQDPGNLGTIVRIADWFGIDRIIASADTVDIYNPKSTQATMGAIARCRVQYVPNLAETLVTLGKQMPIYGTLLEGDNIYTASLTSGGVIVMGNEGRGISESVRETLTHALTIPSFPADAETVESLNVSVATAITVAEFRRRAQLNTLTP